MLLEGKNAVIYGAGGAIGGEVARTFAREGGRVFLAGRTRDKLEAVAADITAAGGSALTPAGPGRGGIPGFRPGRRDHRHLRQRQQRDVPQLATGHGSTTVPRWARRMP
jgi:NAD(P)-dependent dehydrogenase (short-subunit alcohol dehydrogenase family)